MSALVHGIDVSPIQEGYDKRTGKCTTPADYAAAVTSGRCAFAWVKLTEGEGWTSPTGIDQLQRLHAAGAIEGAYHYAREGLANARGDLVGAAKRSAQHHVAVTRQAGVPVSLGHMLDLETDTDERTLPGRVLASWAEVWCTELLMLTGGEPLWIYTGFEFTGRVGAELLAHLAEAFPLVLAAYPHDMQKPPPGWRVPRDEPAEAAWPKVPPPWRAWRQWQWTGAGTVPGIHTAVDRIVMRDEDFRALRGRVNTIPSPASEAATLVDVPRSSLLPNRQDAPPEWSPQTSAATALPDVVPPPEQVSEG